MNFEKLYNKYKDGSATPEEQAYVEAEIEKARRLSAFLEKEKPTVAPIEEAEMENVKKARKKHTILSVIRTSLVSVVVVLLVIGAILGGVFGAAVSYANNNISISRETAEATALAAAADYTKNMAISVAPVVVDFDKDFEMSGSLKHSFYYYYIEVRQGALELEYRINSQNGEIYLVDTDWDRG